MIFPWQPDIRTWISAFFYVTSNKLQKQTRTCQFFCLFCADLQIRGDKAPEAIPRVVWPGTYERTLMGEQSVASASIPSSVRSATLAFLLLARSLYGILHNSGTFPEHITAPCSRAMADAAGLPQPLIWDLSPDQWKHGPLSNHILPCCLPPAFLTFSL